MKKNINDILLSFKNTKNDFILFKKILNLYIKENNIKIEQEQNKNLFYKNFYDNLLDIDKKRLQSRKIYDIKYFYYISLRKYFRKNVKRSEEDIKYIYNELHNTYQFNPIKWWDFKNIVEMLKVDKLLQEDDKVYVHNRLVHKEISYIPFYNLTYNENILILYKNIDFDYLTIWEDLKNKLVERNEKFEDGDYSYSYLLFDFSINFDENYNILIFLKLYVENSDAHDYTKLFQRVFEVEGKKGIEDEKIKDKDVIQDTFVNILNKYNNNFVKNIIIDRIEELDKKQKYIEKYKIDKHYEYLNKKQKYEYLLKKRKLEYLDKLLRDKVITFNQYLKAIKEIK